MAKFISRNSVARTVTLVRPYGTQTSTVSDTSEKLKELSDIPGPKGYPIVGTLFEWMSRRHKLHEIMMERYRKYGPISYEEAGNQKFLMVSDPKAVEQCFRQDTGVPERNPVPIWNATREDNNEEFGILISSGEKWSRMRKVVDKTMLKPKQVSTYAKDINQISIEFVERLKRIRGTDMVVEELDTELFNWALESISKLLYDKRMGCLQDNRNPEAKKFIQSINDMLSTTNQLIAIPIPIARTLMKKQYNVHRDAWATIFKLAKECTDEMIEKIQNRASNNNNDNESQEVGVIEYLMLSQELTPKEVFANIAELMTGGVDTTSNTLNFLLYELAANQDIQQKLYDEIHTHIKNFDDITTSDLSNLPYLKCCVKETIRMYPVATITNRLYQNDISILGYRIPAGVPVSFSIYVMGRSEEYFPNPNKFDPSRWLRDGNRSRPIPFSSIPFGFGPRMCIGRRVAELEMQLLICQMLHRFELETINNKPVEMATRMIMVPEETIRLKYIDRH